MQKPIYAAIVSPKGGVGKTTLTMLAASNLHYTTDYHVAVIDCNTPLFPIGFLRNKEIEAATEMPGFGEKAVRHYKKINKKAYWVVNANVKTALETAKAIFKQDDKLNLILFDLPDLMAVDGTGELLSEMDLVIFPITGSRMVTELTGRYIEVLNEQVVTMGKGNIKATYLLPNMINSWERESTERACKALADTTGAIQMRLRLPFTKQVRSEFFDTYYDVGISTLLPTANRYHSLYAKELATEIGKIIQELCGKS